MDSQVIVNPLFSHLFMKPFPDNPRSFASPRWSRFATSILCTLSTQLFLDLVQSAEDYNFSSARDYLGEDGDLERAIGSKCN